MNFRNGKIIDRIIVNDKSVYSVVFRHLRRDDDARLRRFVNFMLEHQPNVRFFRTASERLPKDFFDDIMRKSKTRSHLFIIGEVNERIVLVAALSKGRYEIDKHTAEMLIGIHPQFRKAGIGTHAANILFSWAHDAGIELIKAAYYDGNDAANIFYKKLGFREAGKLPKGRKAGNKYLDEILVTKRIGE